MGNLNLFQTIEIMSKKLLFWTNLGCSETLKIVISKKATGEDVGILSIAKISCQRMWFLHIHKIPPLANPIRGW
jgi:hypothetical protein